MKKIALLCVLLLMVTGLSACKDDEKTEPASMPDYIDIVADDSEAEVQTATNAVSEALCGGWNTPESGALTDEATAAFNKATADLTDYSYTPSALVGTQVVAGTNYAFVCIRTDKDGNRKPMLVTVYADLQGGAEILSEQPLAVTQ